MLHTGILIEMEKNVKEVRELLLSSISVVEGQETSVGRLLCWIFCWDIAIPKEGRVGGEGT